MSNYNLYGKPNGRMFTRNAVKQKTVNTTRVMFRGGIRL